MSPQTAAGDARQGSTDDAAAAGGKRSPFLVSGELFLRSTPQLFDKNIQKYTAASKTSSPSITTPSSVAHDLPRRRRPRAGAVPRASNKGPVTARDHDEARHPSAGLLGGVSVDLRELLLCHPDLHSSSNRASGAAAGKTGTAAGLVTQARRERRLARTERIKQLKTSKTIAACMAVARLSTAQKAANGFRKGCDECRARLDTRLGSLVLSYAAAVRAEMAEEDAQTAAEGEHCRREQERLELAARLASIAVAAEYRTRGSVVLRRLPSAHPQHARCLRAATENVKGGFFSSSELPYDAVRVLDIYKIENRYLLERFQRAAETTEPCKVKGLFCHVPYDSLEHVVMFGVGAPDDSSDVGENDVSVSDKMFEHEWAASVAVRPLPDSDQTARRGASRREQEIIAGGRAGRSKSKGERTAAAGDALMSASRRGEPLQFPRAFSRHSTLEEERDYVNNKNRDGRPGPGAGDHSLKTTLYDTDKIRTGQSARRAGGDDGGRRDEDVSGLRLLALCRVMLSNTFVASSPLSDFQTIIQSGTRQRPEGKGVAARGEDSRDGSSHCSGEPSTHGISLPRPPAGQPEYDSVYFPREEEYLLLNRAFVLPEFLMVHRFVGRAPPPPSSSTGPPNSSSNPDVGNAESRVEASASSLGGPGSPSVDGENDKNNEDKPSSPSAISAPPHLRPRQDSHSSPVDTAASVVEGIEAAMSRCHVHGAAASLGSAGATPSFSASGVVPGVYKVPPLAASLLASCRSALGAVGGMGGLDFSSWSTTSAVGDVLTREAYRQRERGSGGESREGIVRAFELAFAGYRQDVARLRETEQREVKAATAKSNVLVAVGDGHR